jgi:hypothetical protein
MGKKRQQANAVLKEILPANLSRTLANRTAVLQLDTSGGSTYAIGLDGESVDLRWFHRVR